MAFPVVSLIKVEEEREDPEADAKVESKV